MPTVPQTRRAGTCKAGDKRRKLRAGIDASLDRLASAVDAVRASDEFRRYLDVQAKFHRYSWHNTFLILGQRPEATRVAGYKTWPKMGRHVRKGEHGIAIFAPCPFKGKEKTDGTRDPDGIFFRVVHVFDVAQTDGEDLPNVDCPALDTTADDLLASLQRVAGKRGIAVEFVESDHGEYGASKSGRITVATGHATGQQAKTLAHELAHEALHWPDGKPIKLDRNTAELEAESVAYVVSRHFGLDAEIRSSRYIALWGGDSKALRASLERISKTARAIIDDVEALDTSKAVA